MTPTPAFLPESLRPVPKKPRRRRRRKPLLLGVALIVLGLISGGLYLWRVEEIRLESCPGLPSCVSKNLQSFRGAWIPTLDLDSLRRQVDCWPGIRKCEISLRLPGEIFIRAEADTVAASFRTGLSWRALSPRGEVGRRIERPFPPVLDGFPLLASEMRRGLNAGETLARKLHGKARALRWITPEDLEVSLELDDSAPPVTLRVDPGKDSAGERAVNYLRKLKNVVWADLRQPDRIVIREHS